MFGFFLRARGKNFSSSASNRPVLLSVRRRPSRSRAGCSGLKSMRALPPCGANIARKKPGSSNVYSPPANHSLPLTTPRAHDQQLTIGAPWRPESGYQKIRDWSEICLLLTPLGRSVFDWGIGKLEILMVPIAMDATDGYLLSCHIHQIYSSV